ncbi:ABC transporter ATP-binding protein [Treponema pedis]|uniref:ABC transporter ATP-binding protein n=1 Tax=Treponema pedis TaxID=409322 RepID=UPI000402B2E0|nr:ABC transporter ATP-binding protein [Treponema pedis]
MERIRVSNLNYELNNRRILNSVNISISEGQFVGIIGPNGSGKTSLLKHIYRVLPVVNKTVFINGKDINRMSIQETARFMTVMKQENELAFDYTNLEMVLMGRAPHKKIYEGNNREDMDLAVDALKYVGMEKVKNRLFSTLSGGEKQRILMARSLVQDTEVFILDEPTNHLDVYYQWHLMKLIKNLGKTVLAVFHDLSIALEYCDYLYVLNEGQVVKKGFFNQVMDSELLHEIFHVDGDIIKINNGKYRVLIHGSI